MTIINHKYKFIHLHNPKSAGSSFEFSLSKYCHSTDIVTPEFEELKDKLGYQKAANYKTTGKKFYLTNDLVKKIALNFREFVSPQMGGYHSLLFHQKTVYGRHSSAESVRKNIGDNVWRDYLKFSIIREPVSQFMSFYRYREGKPLMFDVEDKSKACQTLSFSDFVNACAVKFFKISNGITCPGSNNIHYLRYETLSNDLADLSEKIGLPENLSNLMDTHHFRKSKPLEINPTNRDINSIYIASGELAGMYQQIGKGG